MRARLARIKRGRARDIRDWQGPIRPARRILLSLVLFIIFFMLLFEHGGLIVGHGESFTGVG
jgi:hypothetical protein